jgi:hypothetical protein
MGEEIFEEEKETYRYAKILLQRNFFVILWVDYISVSREMEMPLRALLYSLF